MDIMTVAVIIVLVLVVAFGLMWAGVIVIDGGDVTIDTDPIDTAFDNLSNPDATPIIDNATR